MLRLWLNLTILAILLIYAICATMLIAPTWAALSVALASAALVANACLAVARACTQRIFFANAMWTIVFMCMLGLLLSGTLRPQKIEFDEEIWLTYVPEEQQQAAASLLRGVAMGKIEELPQEWDRQSELALIASYIAIEYENTAFLRHMRDAGLALDTVWDGNSLLVAAVSTGKKESIRLLLESGCEPNQLGEDDLSPLMHASLNGDAESIKLLQKFGAKSVMKNRAGLDASDYARTPRLRQLLGND